MFTTKLSFKNHPFFKDHCEVKPYSLYLKFERKLYHNTFIKEGCLETHLKSLRLKSKMSVTHLAMILNYSRPQYLRMEKGENRFKDEQLETMAVLYGEEMSPYKDMQDVDNLLKKFGYNDNPERAIHLLELAINSITIPSSKDSQKENLSPEINTRLLTLSLFQKKFSNRRSLK